MGVAALVEVVAQFRGKLVGGELLRLVKAVHADLLAVVPPLHHGIKMLQLHGLGLGEVLVALRHIQTVEPSLLGGLGAVKEQDVGGDGGIGRKDTARHTDHGMQVEFGQQLFLDVQLGVVRAEQEAIGQDHRSTAIFLQPVHDDGHEQIGSFRAGQVGGEMVLDLGLLIAAVGRVC